MSSDNMDGIVGYIDHGECSAEEDKKHECSLAPCSKGRVCCCFDCEDFETCDSVCEIIGDGSLGGDPETCAFRYEVE